MSSGLAAQLSQSLEIIVWALVSQWDNSSHSTAPTASTDRAIGQNATAHHHVGDPAEAVEREGRGLWSEKQRSFGAFGMPSVTCDREKAGNEGPVLALRRRALKPSRCRFPP